MFDKFFRYIVTLDSSQADQRISGFESRAGKIGSTIGSNMKEIIMLSGKALAVGYSMKKAFDFGLEGAKTSQLRSSFERMNTEIFKSPDLLKKMSEASKGTISEIDLMQYAMLLTIGSTDELARSMAQALPKIVEIAKASAKLNPTLGDMNYLFQSITTGIKRNSPLFLDNAGLIISSERANKLYAESLGKTADKLTETEQKMALLNEVVSQGEVIIRQAGGNLESQADKYDAFATHLNDVWESIKSGIDYLINPLITNLNERFDRLNKFGSGDSPLMNWLREQWEELRKINEELERSIGLRRDQGTNIQLNNINDPFGGYNIPGFNLIGGYAKNDPKDENVIADQVALIESAKKKVADLEALFDKATSKDKLKSIGEQLKKAKKELDALQGFGSNDTGSQTKANIFSASDLFKEMDEENKKALRLIEEQSFAYKTSREGAQKELELFIRDSDASMIKDEYERRIAQARNEAEDLRTIYKEYLDNNYLTEQEYEEAIKQIRAKNLSDVYEIEKEKLDEIEEKRAEINRKEIQKINKVFNIISREIGETGNKFIDDMIRALNVAIEIASTLQGIEGGGGGNGILGFLGSLLSFGLGVGTGGAAVAVGAIPAVMHEGGIIGKDERALIGKVDEMVLNNTDQSNLFKMIKSGNGITGSQNINVIMQVDSKTVMSEVVQPHIKNSINDLVRRRLWSF